ncbi:Inner membrane transport protein YajR [Aliarcobacter thereius]|uniref:Inner membrane transport protein YajR n=1 Tax=Aliarcobacter thereius TaxID=544718 RepID=A0A1C0B5Y7_9BACT|nr:MFS transporter [Aliarcobacter thereius]OCL89812.1 Inner membrane transport protein YajR [Aliarcobacter thereius]OCL98578.1 Inner membrane transport protein YajR [Aliarcobacter thereius]TLS71562.1 MFS transporter [Aliarcobacter thereius]TLT06199.1 MFS transporter [Aliarcobacter thereius]HJE03737.1 MFS transporter [Aliarcobacter thereius]
MFKSVLPLSFIVALRFFGLFIVLPVISVYALSLEGANATLVGIVVGGYALTQVIFQTPFGIMSDKLGRKGTIITGLLLFAIGSFICAIASDIFTLMLGRLLQGAGAIGAVVTAMISDIVKEEQRSKAMAIMGGFIGISFALAMMFGPIIGGYAGVPILFYITMVLSLVAIYILVKKVPNPPVITHTYNEKLKLKDILGNSNINRMHITNFLQKALMTFAFLVIPIILTKTYNWDIKDLWQVYIPSMILGLLAMGPAAILAEKKGKYREVLVIGILFFIISYLIIGFSSSALVFSIGVVIFFIGFNMHEPIMQSLTSKFAKVHQRGSVLGVFNSFGYLGTFFGGIFGGIFLDKLSAYELENFTTIIASICVLWILLIAIMKNPSKTKNIYLNLDEYKSNSLNKLSENSNIEEWYINNTENIAVIKFSEEKISEDEIKAILK